MKKLRYKRISLELCEFYLCIQFNTLTKKKRGKQKIGKFNAYLELKEVLFLICETDEVSSEPLETSIISLSNVSSNSLLNSEKPDEAKPTRNDLSLLLQFSWMCYRWMAPVEKSFEKSCIPSSSIDLSIGLFFESSESLKVTMSSTSVRKILLSSFSKG